MSIESGERSNVRIDRFAQAGPALILPTPRRKEWLRFGISIALMAVDVICIASAFMAAAAIRLSDPFDAQTWNVVAVTVPIYLAVATNSGAYSIDVLVNGRRGASRAVVAALLSMAAVLGVAFYLKLSVDLSRAIMTVGMAGSALSLSISRPIVARLSGRLLGGRPTSEILICDDVTMPRGWLHSRCPVIDAAAVGLAPSIRDPVMLDRLGQSVHCYDRVIIACPPERRRDWALALKGSGVSVELLTAELDEIGTLAVASHLGATTAVVACGALDVRDRAIKRIFDLMFVLPLLPFLLPLFIIAAIAIKLDSPGPALFVQPRVGRGNRTFAMFKFRSMSQDRVDYSGARSASKDDDRITRVGRLLRKTSIDELPQLLNIVKGDMSIVGPRPHATASTAENALFWEVDERYWNRHAAKPGLTGLAQVRGFRGATLTRSDLINRLQADLEYVAGWSIWRDLAIICRTFFVVAHKNAF